MRECTNVWLCLPAHLRVRQVAVRLACRQMGYTCPACSRQIVEYPLLALFGTGSDRILAVHATGCADDAPSLAACLDIRGFSQQADCFDQWPVAITCAEAGSLPPPAGLMLPSSTRELPDAELDTKPMEVLQPIGASSSPSQAPRTNTSEPCPPCPTPCPPACMPGLLCHAAHHAGVYIQWRGGVRAQERARKAHHP